MLMCLHLCAVSEIMTSDLRAGVGWCGGRSASGPAVRCRGRVILRPGPGAVEVAVAGVLGANVSAGDRRDGDPPRSSCSWTGPRRRQRAAWRNFPPAAICQVRAPDCDGGTKVPSPSPNTGTDQCPAAPLPRAAKCSFPARRQPAPSLAPRLAEGALVRSLGQSKGKTTLFRPRQATAIMLTAAATGGKPAGRRSRRSQPLTAIGTRLRACAGYSRLLR